MVVLDDDADKELETEQEPDEGLLEATLTISLLLSAVLLAGLSLLLFKSSSSIATQLGRRLNYKKGNKKVS
jgi:hypothetical protein